jgi:hypothetical protein
LQQGEFSVVTVGGAPFGFRNFCDYCIRSLFFPNWPPFFGTTISFSTEEKFHSRNVSNFMGKCITDTSPLQCMLGGKKNIYLNPFK